MGNCSHKYVHKETIRERISYGRSSSRSETFVKTDYYFCECCLEEKKISKEWCGQLHHGDCPDWCKIGVFSKKVLW